LSGQYRPRVRVVAFNTAEGWEEWHRSTARSSVVRGRRIPACSPSNLANPTELHPTEITHFFFGQTFWRVGFEARGWWRLETVVPFFLARASVFLNLVDGDALEVRQRNVRIIDQDRDLSIGSIASAPQ